MIDSKANTSVMLDASNQDAEGCNIRWSSNLRISERQYQAN